MARHVVATVDELPPGTRKFLEIDGRPIAATDTLRVSFGVYPSCEGGDDYRIPEAASVCPAWRGAPRAVDLLISHLTTRLNGRVDVPEGGRIVRR